MRPRILDFWIDHIRVLKANDPKLSGARIRAELKKVEAPPTPPPSLRAILRVLEEFQDVPRVDQERYKHFVWPHSMDTSQIPWEASRIVLDLIRYRAEQQMEPPLVREAEWFYRVSIAAPDATISMRFTFTLAILAGGTSGWLEKVLAFRPWRSSEDAEAYRRLPLSLRQEPELPLFHEVKDHYAPGHESIVGWPTQRNPDVAGVPDSASNPDRTEG